MFLLTFFESVIERDDFYVNLIAGVVVFFLDVLITYFIISKILESRQRKRWLPARRQLVEHLLVLHQLVMQAAQEAVRYRVKKDLPDGIAEIQQFQAEWYLRESFVGPLRHSLVQFEKLMNLYNVSLDSELLSDLAEYYVRCDRLIEFVSFAVAGFDPKHADKDFCCPAPKQDVVEMEQLAFRLQEVSEAKWRKMYDTTVSAKQIVDVWDEVESKHSRLHLTEKMKTAGGKGLLVVPNADIVRNIHPDKMINAIQTLGRTSALR